MVWHGYVERHHLQDSDRKAAGAARRLQRESEIALTTPQDVADWIVRRSTEVAKDADPDAQVKNGLMIRHGAALRGAASRGGSAYATVHVSRTEVIDLCAEITEDDDVTSGRGVLSS